MNVQNCLGTGQSYSGIISGQWGPQEQAASKHSYSSITAINTSVRDSKNVLEVSLEKQQGATFRLNQMEIESLIVTWYR